MENVIPNRFLLFSAPTFVHVGKSGRNVIGSTFLIDSFPLQLLPNEMFELLFKSPIPLLV